MAFSFLEEADVQPGFYQRPSLNSLTREQAFGCVTEIAVLAAEHGCGLELGVIYPQQNQLAPANVLVCLISDQSNVFAETR